MCSQCEGLRGADVEACIPKRSRYLEKLNEPLEWKPVE